MTKPSLGLTGSVPGAVVATKYDRFSTLPYLQLSGWTAADAFLLVLLMMGAYLTYGYLTASLVSVEPLRRSEAPQRQYLLHLFCVFCVVVCEADLEVLMLCVSPSVGMLKIVII